MKTKKSKAKIIFNVLIYALLAILIAIVGLGFVAKVKGEVFFIGDKAAVWVLTDSMEDKIPMSSYIMVERVDPKDIKEGDIITFYSEDPNLRGNLNTHRVVEITENGEFVTKGDNNAINDQYNAKGEKIVGKYIKNLGFLTFCGRILQTPTGIFTVIVAVCILTLALYIPDIIKGAKKEIQEDTTTENTKK